MERPDEDEKLRAAQLQVVQGGSRASFRRRVIDALTSVVPASGAIFCLGTHDARAYGDSTRVVDGAQVQVTPRGGDGAVAGATASIKLSIAFGFEPRSVIATSRRAYIASELYPDAEREKVPFFHDHSVPKGFGHALLVFLHEGGVLFGLAGLERRKGEAPFSAEDTARIESVAPFVVAGARAQLAYDELTREAAALRALGKTKGTLYIVDRDRRRVIWAADRERGVDWEADVMALEGVLVDGAEQALAARKRGDALPSPPPLPGGTLVAIAKIEGDPVFGGARCAVVRVEHLESVGQPALEGLSKREREIARLLVAGYSGVNVAAIAGLSENTVRTYVRRLYQKLGVSNRADLVRKLVAPEPMSGTGGSPSSQIAPPPDSSLIHGDDTLD